MSRRVLLFGGIDPSGGAGITADATVVAMHGAQPLPIAVCLTVQAGSGFQACLPVPPTTWSAALRAVLADGPVHAVKLGLLGDAEQASAVAAALQPLRASVPIVVDPVLSATSGGWQPAAALLAAYRERLLPLASVFTPNLPELESLCDGDPTVAARFGAQATLVKGGHAEGPWSEDVLVVGGARFVYRRPRLDVGRVRGTGCALASAIAAGLARGLDIPVACQRAGDWLARLLQQLGPAPSDSGPRSLPWAAIAPRPLH